MQLGTMMRRPPGPLRRHAYILNGKGDKFLKSIMQTVTPFQQICSNDEPYYDVAIWRVRPLTFGKYIRPICLPAWPRGDPDSYVHWSVETMGEYVKCSTLR